ncbi:helix-hairpin-helix domain-containing protein [Paenibacillus sp. N4]|uniref:ComEA family DNA-binding protein n=1 Tax=Paenibacillus vietnamensis TaxID=2590547 RepID=UPI001CD0C8E8|nr:helix-hairpin-helix domain-containing protein [Paenibacillus vietnamensis]MCA0754630.1 helix-hairpin-helix domain-containing protein [Paenibacillus vietnamensis]
MKARFYGLTGTRLIAAAVLIAGALLLFAAALPDPKQPSGADWSPLNAEVQAALKVLDAEEEGEKEAVAEISATAAGSGLAGGQADEAEGDAAGRQAPETAVEMENGEAAAAAGDGRLDINRASAAELDALKGIGPAKAEAIVADRGQNGKFKSVRDLLRVKGIGEKLLSGIEESIVARP